MGWNLTGFGISRITRCQKTIAEDGIVTPVAFTIYDAFCLDGQRLLPTGGPAVNGKTVYEPEHDPWTRVLFGSDALTFEVDLRDGRVLTYGTNDASRHRGYAYQWIQGSSGALPNPNNPVVIYAWALDSVTDPSGNQMTISYTTQTDTQ